MKCVYRHRRLDNNEVFYVGLGNYDRPYRKTNRTKIWNNIVDKAGYTVEVLCKNLSEDNAVELEMFLIQEYGDKLCNFTIGGEVGCLGYKHSKEALDKIRDSSLGRKFRPKTKEEKDYLSRCMLGSKWNDNQYKSHNKIVLQFNKKGDFVREWSSAEEAGRELNINSGNICSCRNGNRKSAGGYVWKHKLN